MPKTMFYNTTVTFGGANFPASSFQLQETQEMVDTTTTADGGYKTYSPGLIDRTGSATVYKGTSNLTLPAIGANGTLSWTGSSVSFPAYVKDIQTGQAQINGAIPITIQFQGSGNGSSV
jgi:hypothetical protein